MTGSGAVARVRVVAIGVRRVATTNANGLKVAQTQTSTVATIGIVTLCICRVSTTNTGRLIIVKTYTGVVARVGVVAVCVADVAAGCTGGPGRMDTHARIALVERTLRPIVGAANPVGLVIGITFTHSIADVTVVAI